MCVCVGGVKGYILFLELLTHIAKLASRKAGLRYAPGSGLPECLLPCMITSMGYYACGFIFLVFSENPVFSPSKEGGARGPFWTLRVAFCTTLREASFPPCF